MRRSIALLVALCTLSCSTSNLIATQSDGFPPTDPIGGVTVTMRGDTAVVTFEPVGDALDYRIYPMPPAQDILVDASGTLSIRNAIYRCGGDRQFQERDVADSLATSFDFYARSESESILGDVYLAPGTGRLAVHRLADPRADADADPGVPEVIDSRNADYVTDETEYAMLLASGWRDDGIVFYAPTPDSTTRPVYRWESVPLIQDRRLTTYFVDGPERVAFEAQTDIVAAEGVRFHVLSSHAPGSVALHRVFYEDGHGHDVLAAGDARFARTLHQGNRPVWFLSWPGITEHTTLVIEALDRGCPWPGGHVGATHADGDPPTITVDEARLPSGEVFINGQHDPANRPRAIARALVEVDPAPITMAWFEGFDGTEPWDAFDESTENNGFFYFRNARWSADFSYCSDTHSFGPVLGELVVTEGDTGAACHFRISPRDITPSLSASSFLHVTMEVDVPATGRRFPQTLLTTVPLLDPSAAPNEGIAPLQQRLDTGVSIIVQPVGAAIGPLEQQIQFCDHQAWNIGNPCPIAEIYGRELGSYSETRPWAPIPVLGELAGFDRRVRFDVYASTDRVYLLLEGVPAGCAVLPTGSMPAGPVTVAFGSMAFDLGIDEWVVPDDAPQQFLHRYSVGEVARRFDNLGIEENVSAPSWNEALVPCTSTYH